MTAPVPATRRRMTRALVARVGEELFAFPVSGITEAVDAPEVAPVPLAPEGVAGQAHHRDRLLPVLDPRVLLGVARGEGTGTLLVMPGARPWGLWVDDLSDLVAVDRAVRRPLPPGSDRTGMLTGLLIVDDTLAGVVHVQALHRAAESLLSVESSDR